MTGTSTEGEGLTSPRNLKLSKFGGMRMILNFKRNRIVVGNEFIPFATDEVQDVLKLLDSEIKGGDYENCAVRTEKYSGTVTFFIYGESLKDDESSKIIASVYDGDYRFGEINRGICSVVEQNGLLKKEYDWNSFKKLL